MKGRLFGAALVASTALASLVPTRAHACAGCSNPNLPTARASSTPLAAREVTAAVSLTGTTMHVVHSERCPDIGPICAQRDEPPQLHDQRFYAGEVRPIVAVGLTDTFGVEAQVPFRLLRSIVTFRRLDGTAFTPDYENIHHRDETLAGLGDPWLLGRASWARGPWVLTGRAGVGLPLGGTEPDPFARGRAGLPHQHVQLGTGLFHPVLSLDAVWKLGALRFTGYGQAVLFFYENRHGYRAGNRYALGLGGDTAVVGPLRAGLAVDLVNEQPERWSGVVQQDGNVGRTDLLVGGTLVYTAGDLLASLSVRVPVWQHFIEGGAHGGDPGQLTYPAIVGLSVQYRFGR
jgi:hypothetical protein